MVDLMVMDGKVEVDASRDIAYSGCVALPEAQNILRNPSPG